VCNYIIIKQHIKYRGGFLEGDFFLTCAPFSIFLGYIFGLCPPPLLPPLQTFWSTRCLQVETSMNCVVFFKGPDYFFYYKIFVSMLNTAENAVSAPKHTKRKTWGNLSNMKNFMLQPAKTFIFLCVLFYIFLNFI